MRHPLPLYVVLLLTGISLAACGVSEPDVGVVQYIDSVGPAFEQARAAREALNEEISPPGAESGVADAKLWFDQVVETQESLLDALRSVGDPPALVREAHDDLVAASSELQVINRRIRNQLADAGPDFDIGRLANDPVLGVASQSRLGERVEEACKELESEVGHAGVEADLGCEDNQ